MISKELLSEVLNKNVDQLIIDSKVIENNLSASRSTADIAYRINYDWFYINIHELAHKCKEWAIVNSEYTAFCTQFEKYQFNCHLYKYISIYADKSNTYTFSGDTEPEAIFKATQYIYDNLRN